MKRVFVLVLIVFCAWASIDAKEKPIKYGKYIIYTGEVVNKAPCGSGVLTVSSKESSNPVLQLSGIFQNTTVSDGTMTFPGGYSFKGDISYNVTEKPSSLTIILVSGNYYDKNDKLIGAAISSEPLSIAVTPGEVTHLAGSGEMESRAPVSDMSDYIKFAADTAYSIIRYRIGLEIIDSDWEYLDEDYAYTFTVKFSNGTTVTHDDDNQEKWEKPSGELIQIDFENTYPDLLNYRINMGDDYINKEGMRHTVKHTFENGNVYKGTACQDLLDYYEEDYRRLIGLNAIDWKWQDFFSGVSPEGGTVLFFDGSRYEGSFIDNNGSVLGDKLTETSYETGKLYDQDGKIIHEYKGGKNEVQLAEEARKAEEERQRRMIAYEESLKTDFVTFAPENTKFIRKFKKTLPNMTVIEGENNHEDFNYSGSSYSLFKITYPDGTVFECEEVVPSQSDWFESNILNMPYAPKFSDITLYPLEQSYYGPTYLSILQGTWTFPDGVIIKGRGSLSFSPNESGDSVFDLDNYGAATAVYSIRDQKNDGDYGIIKMRKHDGHYHQDRITEFRKTLPDCIANARKPYYDIWALTTPDNYFEGDIRYNDGGRFEGVFSATIEEGYAAIGSDPRIRTLGSKIESSIDNILEIKEIEGRKYNADGKLVAAFEEGKQVSDFRLAQIIAADKAKIEKEEEEVRERQRREKLYEETCKKYGKKYVDAWIFEETFIVGTPEEFLLEEVDVKPYYESNYTRSYRLVNIIGETLVNIDVDKSTGRIK